MPKYSCRPRTFPEPADRQCDDDHTALVRLISRQIFARVPKHASVEMTDILQAGHLGLLRARASYRAESEVPFAVYARYRVRGEILDMLRRLDSAPRSLRRWQRTVESHSHELTLSLQRVPTDEELSASLGVGLTEVRKNRHAVWCASPETERPARGDSEFSTREQDWTASPDWMPDVMQERKESIRILLNSISALPPRARQVVLLYYQRDFTMKQIGAVMQVNESRVSQIHKTALQTMSAVLQSAGIRSVTSHKSR